VSIQAIKTDGTKDFLAGARTKGCSYPIGKIRGATGLVVIAEGAATLAAVCDAMGCPGVAALSAGNLEPVAREIKKLAPGAKIVIIADNDIKPDTDCNPGIELATKAAADIGAMMAIPELDGHKCDAWDVLNKRGPEGIKAMIEAATAPSVATVATVAVATPENFDLDTASEEIQRLREAMKWIPKDARSGKHDAAHVVGYGARHNESGIETHIGAAICEEWDTRTGGNSLEVFTTCDPSYNRSAPVTVASIYDLAKKNGWDGQAPWGEPTPLIESQEAAPYPLEALPETIRQAVDEVNSFVQSPVAMSACAALITVSLVVQPLADVRRASKLEGPTSIFSLGIADSGERKTTVDGFFTSPVREWEAEQREVMAPLVKEYTAALQSWEAKQSGLTTSIKEYSKGDKDTILLEQKLTELEKSMPIAPRVPRLMYADATPEALAHALAHKWPSGGVISSEAGIVFGGHAMGKDSSMRNMALLNSLWDGASITIDRKTGPSFILQGARLTMGLAVQPETIKAFLDSSKGLARGIGFLARFLVAWPASTQGFREFQEPPENWPHLSKFHRRIGALLDHSPTINDQGGLEPVMLELSPKAKAAWVEFHNEVELELRPGRDMAETRDVASKTADNAARLAALFHVFEIGLEGAIGEDHMQRAAAIASWHLYEARRFMQEIAVPTETINALKLDAWLIGYCRENRVTEINRRTIQQSGPNCIRSKEVLNGAIEALIEAGRARLVKSGKAKIVQINPALLNEVK
jgi:hypothetical protein